MAVWLSRITISISSGGGIITCLSSCLWTSIPKQLLTYSCICKHWKLNRFKFESGIVFIIQGVPSCIPTNNTNNMIRYRFPWETKNNKTWKLLNQKLNSNQLQEMNKNDWDLNKHNVTRSCRLSSWIATSTILAFGAENQTYRFMIIYKIFFNVSNTHIETAKYMVNN